MEFLFGGIMQQIDKEAINKSDSPGGKPKLNPHNSTPKIKPSVKSGQKKTATKESAKADAAKKNPPEFFADLHPDLKQGMENLNEFYASIMEKIPQPAQLNLFSAEIMGKTFAETHKVLVDTFVVKPDEWDSKQRNYLSDLEILYQRTMDRLQGADVEPVITPNRNDRRFKAPEWQEFPVFDYVKQSYLLHSKYMNGLIESLEGINVKTKEKAQFYTRSILDAAAPTNFPFSNPEVLRETIRTQGQNLVNGSKKLLDDNLKTNFLSLPMFTNLKEFKVGENLAITPGKVVYETPLFQLLYFKPTVTKVYERPLLIIPPWINKYYIFDLQQENSFIGWMLNQGFSVFVISWINPDATYADHGLDEYVLDGALDAVHKVLEISGQAKLNLFAYCTGGVAATLLAGYLAKRIEKNPIASLSLLATPIDFDKMGDLKVFICDEQLDHLEKRVKQIGYLPGDEMVRVFSMLRANDLIWSNYVNTYLLNKETFPLDFLYWNCDTTHIAATLHMQYLRNIFFENGLMNPNSLQINGQGIDLQAIATPIFAFATRSDHIVPWQSAYAIKQLCPTNTKFVLGASGHVAGIINPIHRQKYCYWTFDDGEDTTKRPEDPAAWIESASEHAGSWWPEWHRWIANYTGLKITTDMWKNTPNIEAAPGRYVVSSSPCG